MKGRWWYGIGVFLGSVTLTVAASTNNISTPVLLAWPDGTNTNKPVTQWETIAFSNSSGGAITNFVVAVMFDIKQAENPNQPGIGVPNAKGEAVLDLKQQALNAGKGALTFNYMHFEFGIFEAVARTTFNSTGRVPGDGIGWAEVTLYDKAFDDDRGKRIRLSNTIRRAFEVKQTKQ